MPRDEERPARARRRVPSRRPRGAARATSIRSAAVAEVEGELEAWRVRAVPDGSAPLEAEDLARLVHDCLRSLGLNEAGAADFTVNTVHYYRRKDILDAPDGRTSAARYTLRHVWQAVGARLAGQLGLLTLAEARDAMSGESEEILTGFVAERVLDARARHAVRRGEAVPLVAARPLAASKVIAAAVAPAPAPHQSAAAPATGGIDAVVVPLPSDAWCVLPAAHPARHSASAARALVRALADALHARPDITEL